MDVETTVPKALHAKGLRRVTDNLQPDQQVVIKTSLIWMFFEKELKERFVKPRAGCTRVAGCEPVAGGEPLTPALSRGEREKMAGISRGERESNLGAVTSANERGEKT